MRLSGRHGLAACSAILLLAFTAPALAQTTPTLGDIAQKEQERRKGAKQPAKVYTNDDLKGGGLPKRAAPPADAHTAASGRRLVPRPRHRRLPRDRKMQSPPPVRPRRMQPRRLTPKTKRRGITASPRLVTNSGATRCSPTRCRRASIR